MATREERARLTAAWHEEALRRIAAGESTKDVAGAVGRSILVVNRLLVRNRGFIRRPRHRSARQLSLAEREEISRGLRSGQSCRGIAGQLHRAPSSVSREVRRHGGAATYRAWAADIAALRLLRRPKAGKIERSVRLRAAVERLLALRWSPEQVSAALRREYPGDVEMQVSHEAIYRSLYVQARGSLKKELVRHLRTYRLRRHPRRKGPPLGGLKDIVPISARPPEAADRAVPGHWEGDLLEGKRHSAIGTLVERRSRNVLLLRLANGHSAPEMRRVLARRITRLPRELRRTLTWDRGNEMADHVRFTVDTGVQVFFCDPRSPWQRGSNENTNGLLRQYFPRTLDLASVSQARLDAVARQLNARPRETLGWKSPAEVLAEAISSSGD